MKSPDEVARRIHAPTLPPMDTDFALTYQPHDRVPLNHGQAMYEYGWMAGVARALTLAVKFGPDNDYRLRRALIDLMDECPDLTPKTEEK